ncbi:MAG: NUDIX hydrolase [Rhodopirellula sp. JB053]|uniref:NUDIX hydrolase n=1 Tax=Rhodopirellula sp. JB044 TaxID=3342844 RepID=UPI00370A7424
MDREIGVLPYRKHKNRLEVVLVTTRRRKYWIFPKGQTEKHKTASEVAQLEAFEEAGVTGNVKKSNNKKFRIRRGGRKVEMRVFPMKLDEVLPKWPEDDERERVVVSVEEALKMIKGKSLRKCVKQMLRNAA